MNRGLRYKTRQKDEILTYLLQHKGSAFTAGQIVSFMKEAGANIGRTTIYRQLERLVEEGVVLKYSPDGERGSLYEYIGQEDCHEPYCFHCKCIRCGSLIHLECEELEEVNHHLAAAHGFHVDPVKTVIYGLCEQCEKESGR